jgi:hypothetical protein
MMNVDGFKIGKPRGDSVSASPFLFSRLTTHSPTSMTCSLLSLLGTQLLARLLVVATLAKDRAVWCS